jgi:transcriptional regulator with XRE-family HTH domain
MKLDDWMAKRRVSDELLANELGVSRATVSRLRRGLQVPSMRLAARIAEFTKGRVTANDFMPPLDAPEKTPQAAE